MYTVFLYSSPECQAIVNYFIEELKYLHMKRIIPKLSSKYTVGQVLLLSPFKQVTLRGISTLPFGEFSFVATWSPPLGRGRQRLPRRLRTAQLTR